MQKKDMLVFALLATLLVTTWYFVFGPSASDSKKDDDADKKLVEAKKDKDKKKDEDKKKTDETKKPDVKQPDLKKGPEAVAKEEPPKTERLGGDDFHLTVDVTSRGAAVRRVVLNRFKAADWRGRPTEREFELIQDDEFAPSYRMYHYLGPNDQNPIIGLGEKTWKFENRKENEDKSQELTYSTTVPGMPDIKIVKKYTLAPKDYHVTLLVELHDMRDRKGADKKEIPLRYQLTGAQGLPIEGEWYASTFRNAFMALVDPNESVYRKLEESGRISGHKGGDAWPTNKLGRSNNRLQYAGVANQFFAAMVVVDNEQPKKEVGGKSPNDILAWARPTLETSESKGRIKGMSTVNGNVTRVTLVDDNDKLIDEFHLLPRTMRHFQDLEIGQGQVIVLSWYEMPDEGNKKIATWVRKTNAERPSKAPLRQQFDDITVRVNSEVESLYPGDIVKHQFLLYHGPVKAALLKQFRDEKEVDPDLVTRYTDTLHLNTLTDYHSDNWISTHVFSNIGLTYVIIQVTRFMHWLLDKLHYVFGYGLSIVVLTVMVRGAMFPISRRQALFSIKMQELAPELKKIQDRYADDQQGKMQATQEFYRKHGINPLGSCWPVFLQMPIFLGLYFALQESIHFRLANFLWIQNLAAPDMLVWWTEMIPWISDPDSLGSMLYLGPYLNILPMIAVVLMMFQQMQTMPPPTDEQQAMQQKMLKYMTIFFGIMFYKVAAGLCIYFIASSLWGMAERKLLPKKKGAAGPSLAPGAAASSTNIKAGNPAQPTYKTKIKAKKDKATAADPATPLGKLKALWQEILKQAEKK
jgi:YidC/Oxa1 family membrane protein insertase